VIAVTAAPVTDLVVLVLVRRAVVVERFFRGRGRSADRLTRGDFHEMIASREMSVP